jgi:hypothetical protein
MGAYSVVLAVHLLALLLAAMASAVALSAALQLRHVTTPPEAARWGRMVASVVPAFPIATVTLLGSGAYMTQAQWTWHTAWIDAGLAGLGLITVCGSGIEAPRGRLLKRELMTAGMSDRARRLLRDPYAWSAKMTTLTVMVGVVFVMSTKPDGLASAVTIAAAVVAGVLAAIPFWRPSATATTPPTREPARAEAE